MAGITMARVRSGIADYMRRAGVEVHEVRDVSEDTHQGTLYGQSEIYTETVVEYLPRAGARAQEWVYEGDLISLLEEVDYLEDDQEQ